MINPFYHFRMQVFEVFNANNFDDLCVEVIACLNHAYASGYKSVQIYLKDEFAFKCLAVWTPGWSRRAYPRFLGVWLNSRGIL